MIERLDHLERAGGIALTLRRAWARSATHLLLEYLDERGAIVPGQWMADPEETKRRVEATRDRAPEAGVEWIESTGVLLQPGGADRKLRGIPTLLREPGTVLLSHRPERRAVVQRAGGRFTKVLRPGRAEAMVDGLERLTTALAGGQCRVPTLTDVDVAAGHVTCAALPGRSMDDVLDESGRAPAAARAAGVALRHL
ncbi:MAG: hypothetical protein KJO43_15420, partial [Phycisphaerae bacterium]|nr:hypothetical protein [Phycisphaerae bacterium]